MRQRQYKTLLRIPYFQANKYPWLARVLIGTVSGPISNRVWTATGYECGGSIVASLYIITAAHCIQHMDEDNFFIRNAIEEEIRVNVGEHNWNIKGEENLVRVNENVLRVSKIYRHHRWEPDNYENGYDIAILKIFDWYTSPYEIDLKKFTPVCLAPRDAGLDYDEKMARVVGWGKTSEQINLRDDQIWPKTPHEIDLRILSYNESEPKRFIKARYFNRQTWQYGEKKGDCSVSTSTIVFSTKLQAMLR